MNRESDMESRLEEKLLGPKEKEGGNLWENFCTESKKLWKVAGPSVLTRISMFGLLVVTQAFMGHIGETQLAAYALVSTVLMRFANGILLGMASALETLCGQAFGAGQYHMMGIYMQRSWLVLGAAFILLLPVFIFADPIFRLLGQEEELSVLAGEISLWFMPTILNFIFIYTLQMFLQGQLKNAIIAWYACASLLIHVPLSWVLVDKLNLGIGGAMGSLIVAYWVPVIGQFVYVFGGWCPETWRGFSMSAFSELWPIVKLSVASGFMLCLEVWYNSVLILLAGYMKNAEIAIDALSICLNITAWEMMISIGFLSATSVRVSNELGRGNARGAKFAIKVVLSTSLAIGVFFWILFMALGNVISYVFTSSEEVAEAVSNLSVLLAFSVLLNSIQPVLSGVAVGAGWQGIVAYVNVGCYYVIGIPLGVLLGYLTSLEIKGIWIGMMCGIAAQTLVLIFITWRTDWDLQVEKASARLNRWFLPNSNESGVSNGSGDNTSPGQ